MSVVDFSRWVVAAYNDDTGLGRMAEDIRNVLGLGSHWVAPSERLETKPLGPADILLKRDTSADAMRLALAELDGIILLEKPSWNPLLPRLAWEAGVATVVVPMWEWFNVQDPCWRQVDLLACPNRKCLEVVRRAGFANAIELPWTLDMDRLPRREVAGPARHFIHNAGLMDRDDRKGTRDVIRAFRRVKAHDVRLTVRLQKPTELPELDNRIEVLIGNVSAVAELWSEGDVAVQPSKLEGIGFMVLEPVCAGLPVITTNAPPMNEYAAMMKAPVQWLSRPAFASQWAPQARLRPARIGALARAIERCAEIDLAGASRSQRAWAEERFDRAKLRAAWSGALAPLLRRRSVAA